MRKSVLVFVTVMAGGLLASPAALQDLGPTGPSPYEVVDGWLKPFAGEGFAFGGNSGVFPESPDRIFVVQRGETRLPDPVPDGFTGFVGSIGLNALREAPRRTWQNCIFIVDGDGNVIDVWDQWDHLFEGSDGPGPHRIRIGPYDPERRVWVVHETGHQIFVFSNDGSELLMTLGEKNVSGDDATHLGAPQDVAFLPDGRVLVADGLINSRVMILDADGNYLTEFGKRGTGRGAVQRCARVGGRARGADFRRRPRQSTGPGLQPDDPRRGVVSPEHRADRGVAGVRSYARHHRQRIRRLGDPAQAGQDRQARPEWQSALHVGAGQRRTGTISRDALVRRRHGRQPLRFRQPAWAYPEARTKGGRRSDPADRTAVCRRWC